jgi:uncharacterized protein YndB with AHSA1/START domain
MRRLHIETTTTDRIHKEIVLKAPRARVWKAISDPVEFGNWFKVDFMGAAFEAGKPARGKMTYPGHEGAPYEMIVDRIEAPRLFSFRWHPYGIDPNVDYSGEPMTLIEFVLEEVAGGTKLTITESGFDAIPLARRAEALRMNDGGWTEQIRNIEAYVTAS